METTTTIEPSSAQNQSETTQRKVERVVFIVAALKTLGDVIVLIFKMIG